ncbi:MAG TPA: XRE family transcriptional regulator [Idiomarina abyssalis]|uniref:XRE family transcriptional regulator n=1 Tax=Idiomarina aquatica TaxID=1327752 RepID=A0AA94ED32_9GAMM|nr:MULTISPECIES: helix-turn-helix transcriptional regulator [Idiomarina]MAB22058.1 transcriptional regulator [Idiomarina sp.]MBH93297.1 transcriptional regulator [Idiomarina sp.]RUO40307.1 XRE family transcriptional regulator [Idiomarina aquatica]HAS13812.1 XRE family transcriptional regulator [Idiomarina abyssalis]
MPSKLIPAVAETVKSLRKSSGLTQEELAAAAELDRTYISGIERGVRNVSLSSIEKLSNALSMTLPDFFDELRNVLIQRDAD